jgi:hypothetical protein
MLSFPGAPSPVHPDTRRPRAALSLSWESKFVDVTGWKVYFTCKQSHLLPSSWSKSRRVHHDQGRPAQVNLLAEKPPVVQISAQNLVLQYWRYYDGSLNDKNLRPQPPGFYSRLGVHILRLHTHEAPLGSDGIPYIYVHWNVHKRPCRSLPL